MDASQTIGYAFQAEGCTVEESGTHVGSGGRGDLRDATQVDGLRVREVPALKLDVGGQRALLRVESPAVARVRRERQLFGAEVLRKVVVDEKAENAPVAHVRREVGDVDAVALAHDAHPLQQQRNLLGRQPQGLGSLRPGAGRRGARAER